MRSDPLDFDQQGTPSLSLAAGGQRVLLVLVGVAIAALGVRAAWAWLTPSLDPILTQNQLYGDAQGYDTIARNLLAGLGFSLEPGTPTSFRPPLYPLFLAFVYWVFGHSLFLARLMQALLGAAVVVPTYYVARRFCRQYAALLAAAGVAVHPLLVYTTGWLYPETLFTTLLLLTVCLALLAADETARWPAAATGAGLGLCALTRPNSLTMVPLIILWLFIIRGLNRDSLIKSVLVVVVATSVVLPWTGRNCLAQGGLTIVSSNGGANFWGGNNPDADGGFTPGSPYVLYGMSEAQSDRSLYSRGLEWIRSNPASFISLLPRKLMKFWSPLELGTSGRFPTKLYLPVMSVWALFLLAVVRGIVVSARSRWRETLLLLLIVISFVITAMVYFGSTRFALPLAPVLVVFAAAGVQPVVARQRLRHD